MLTHLSSAFFSRFSAITATAFIIHVFILIGASTVYARPEYAVKNGYTNCTACHVSPFGGGIRTVNGKLYGSKDFQTALTSLRQTFQGDMRTLAYYPVRPTETPATNGVVLMSAIVAANVPVTAEGKYWEPDVVAAFNLGGILPTGIREAYSLFHPAPVDEDAVFKFLQIGRFNAPFGLLTDEHRTYTRIINRTTINDYEEGFALSGDPAYNFHYDLALTDGLQSGGLSFNLPGDLPWALIGNLRWSPWGLPFFVGGSYSRHRTLTLSEYQPYAAAIYTAVSGGRISKGSVPLTLLAETITARGWGDYNQNPWLKNVLPKTDTALQDALKDSQSLAFQFGADYDLSSHWILQYRFERLLMDHRYPGDAFVRNAFGFKFWINSNMILTARYEINRANRPGITPQNALSARDTIFAMFHVWL